MLVPKLTVDIRQFEVILPRILLPNVVTTTIWDLTLNKIYEMNTDVARRSQERERRTVKEIALERKKENDGARKKDIGGERKKDIA